MPNKSKQMSGKVVMKLPASVPIKCCGMSNVTIPATTKAGVRQIAPADIANDISANDGRNLLFRTVEVQIGPFPGLSMPGGCNVQIVAYDLNAQPIALMRPRQISGVNSTRVRVSIPSWLNGPLRAGSASPFMAVSCLTATAVVGNQNIPFTVNVIGDVTEPLPVPF